MVTLSSTSGGPQKSAVDLVQRLFDILRHRDREAFDNFVDPNMRGFERGQIYTRDTFYQILVDADAAGKEIEWSVTDARAEESEGLAVVSYINKGSVKDGKDAEPTPVSWLETVTFVDRGEGWKVIHLSSMRTT